MTNSVAACSSFSLQNLLKYQYEASASSPCIISSEGGLSPMSSLTDQWYDGVASNHKPPRRKSPAPNGNVVPAWGEKALACALRKKAALCTFSRRELRCGISIRSSALGYNCQSQPPPNGPLWGSAAKTGSALYTHMTHDTCGWRGLSRAHIARSTAHHHASHGRWPLGVDRRSCVRVTHGWHLQRGFAGTQL
jgi:hypothetical protein